MTGTHDLVLIYFEDKPISFARIEAIEPDHKPNWYHIKLLLLQIPLQLVTWILRDAYIDGAEFTMNGKRMRIEKVVSPEADRMPKPQPQNTRTTEPGGTKVISFANLKKDR